VLPRIAEIEMPVLKSTPVADQSFTPVPVTGGNSETIARNTLWYGFEIATGLVTAFITSIVIARAMGPQKLGYFNYIMWLANISAAIGSFGVPATARKYMAEYFGRGEPGISRAIYAATLRLQTVTAGLITAAGLVLVFKFSDRAYWGSSALLVASVLPAMLTWIPAQANMAAENMRANVPSSLLSSVVYVSFVALSLTFGWGLPGIALGFLLSRSSEVILRLLSVRKWMRSLPLGSLPTSLRSRMRTFSGLSTVLMILQVVVWDRSDIVLLKMFSGSIQEITFYSVAFNLTEKVMLLTSTFGAAIGASVMAQFGRDREVLRLLVAKAARYMFLCGLPALLGLALLSRPIIQTLYGRQYLPVIPVLFWAAALAIPKTMLLPALQMLQAAEQQRFLVIWGCFCGAVNITIDLLLIPSHGALGAAIGNGVGQALGVIGMWVRAGAIFRLELPWRDLGRIAVCGFGMALVVFSSTLIFSGWRALAVGVPAGCVAFAVMLRLVRLLTQEDRRRILRMTVRSAYPLRICMERIVWALSPAGEQT
jgi:O-antigen/teichoic acid export membrane protein